MKRSFSLSAFFLFTLFACSLSLWSQGNTYLIKVELSEDIKEASGIQRIEFVNPNNYPLDKIYFRTTEAFEEEAQCQLQKITEAGGDELLFLASNDYPGIFEVKLRRPLMSQGKLNLVMQFSTPVSYSSNYIFGSLRNYWHPRAVPYYEGKLQPFYGEIASYQVEVHLPVEKTVVTSGDVISMKKNSKGMKKVVSQAHDISNFGLVFFDDIEKKESMVKGIKLTIYYAPGVADWTRELEPVAADIIAFYIDTIGFYPEKVINIIPGAIKGSTGGFPLASGIIAIHTLQEKDEQYARWITAHEIAHYYWGFGYVLYPIEYCNWLGIGLGIYTDRLYSEAQSLDRYLYDKLRCRYISGALLGFDTTIMQKMERLTKAHFDWNNVIMHGKSFTVIEMLEKVVGKETFHKIYITLLKRYKYKVLTAGDFQAVCEEISEQKLDWFFQPWLYTNDKLDYVISQVKTYKKEDEFLTRVEVKKTGQISMPIEVEITTIDEEKYSKIFPRHLDKGWIEFYTPSSLKDVKLDPSERLALFSRINDEIIRSMIFDCYNSDQYALSLIFFDEVLLRNPDNVRWLYYKGEALVIIGKFDKALNSFQKVIDFKGNNKQAQNYSVLSHIRKGQVFDLQGRRELALAEYRKAIELPDYQGSHKQAKKYLDQPYKEDEE